MAPETRDLTVTLLVSIVVPLLTLFVKSWVDNQKSKREADNTSKGEDLNALKEVRNNLNVIKQQNEEIVDLSDQLLDKKNEITALQSKIVRIEKQLKDTQAENTKLKENIEKTNERLDMLNKLVKDEAQ